jgi:hypothetical protein
MLCNHRPRTACTAACIRVQYLQSSNQLRQIYPVKKLPGKVLILGAVCLRRYRLPVSNWTQQSYRTCAFLRNAPFTPRIEMLNIPYTVNRVKGVDSRSSIAFTLHMGVCATSTYCTRTRQLWLLHHICRLLFQRDSTDSIYRIE